MPLSNRSSRRSLRSIPIIRSACARRSGISPVGSDSDAFLTAGVPGFFWVNGGDRNYTHVHHTQFDTYEEAVPEYQRNSAIVIAVGALGIANLPEAVAGEGLRATGGGFEAGVGDAELDDDMRIDEVVDEQHRVEGRAAGG